jgi:hypothetical protein
VDLRLMANEIARVECWFKWRFEGNFNKSSNSLNYRLSNRQMAEVIREIENSTESNRVQMD